MRYQDPKSFLWRRPRAPRWQLWRATTVGKRRPDELLKLILTNDRKFNSYASLHPSPSSPSRRLRFQTNRTPPSFE